MSFWIFDFGFWDETILLSDGNFNRLVDYGIFFFKHRTKMSKQIVTVTFGDCAENNMGMQKIGDLAKEGFSFDELYEASLKFEEAGHVTDLLVLNQNLPEPKDQGDIGGPSDHLNRERICRYCEGKRHRIGPFTGGDWAELGLQGFYARCGKEQAGASQPMFWRNIPASGFS